MTGSDSSSSSSWLEENVGRPAVNSLKESANAGLNLVNLVLTPTGAELPKFNVKHGEQTAVGTVVSGLVSAVPYAVAGGAVGKLAGLLPKTERLAVLGNSSLHQITGAGLLDGFRDLRPGETTGGNIAGSVAGFSVFEFGNARIKAASIVGTAAARVFVGASGGVAQSVFSDLGSLRAPDTSKFTDAGITGGGMNLLLPTMQHLVARSFRLKLDTPTAAAETSHPAAAETSHPAAAETSHPAAAETSQPAPRSVAAGESPRPVADTVPVGESPRPLQPAAETARTPEPSAVFNPAAPLKLESYSSFSVLKKFSQNLRREEEALFVSEGADYSTPTYKLRAMEKIEEAQQNMALIAKGELPAEVKASIERGWFPENTADVLKTKLHNDLLKAQQVGETGNNVADIAARSASAAGFQRGNMERLAEQYTGSPTRLVLRALGRDSETLNDMYSTVAGARINGPRVLADTIDTGVSPETIRYMETTQLAIQGVEKALSNPATREAVQAELQAQRMNSADLIDKYASIERAASRAAGPVDLKNFPAWNEAYRLLARVEREQTDPPKYPMSVRESTQWMARSLRHMEEIATGNFEPPVRALFDKQPELLNRMRAELEKDLKQYQRQSETPFHKEDTQNLTYAYGKLFSPYERSPMYRLLADRNEVPVQLNRMYSLVRMMDPVTESGRIERGMEALYAFERGLLDPKLAEEIRARLPNQRVGIFDNRLMSEFSSVFDDLYAHENVPAAPTDQSNVVTLKPKGK